MPDRYIFKIMLDVEVEAFNSSDANEVIDDALGEGSLGGLTIINQEILDWQKLD